MPAVALPEEQRSHKNVLVSLATPKIAVAVYGESGPTESEWKEYLRVLSKLEGSGNKLLVMTAGGGPNTIQREELERLTVSLDEQVRAAIVTTSRVVRGIVTALRWFRSDNYRAFDPKDLKAAFTYLQLSDAEQTAVRDLATTMAERLGVREAVRL